MHHVPFMSRTILAFVTVAALAVLTPRVADEADDTSVHVWTTLSRGTLFICGGGDISDEVMERFVEEAGGENARLVIVTTASETAETDEIEEELEFFRAQNVAALTVLHTRDREIANDPEFAQPLEDATGIWFIGGRQAWLADTYSGTFTERRWHDVLSRGGVVGGTSAGAAIMSSVMIRHGHADPEVGRGFGFLPGAVIDQHFLVRNRQERLKGVVSRFPGLVGLGIDEGAAVMIRGCHMSVLGNAQVVTCIDPARSGRPQMETLEPGSEANLMALSAAARPVRGRMRRN
jgi:cyanophycinase